MIAGWTPLALLVVALAAGLLLAAGSASAQTVESKRAEARAIMAQIEALDLEVAQAAEAWNLANIELERIEADLASNGRHLAAARKSLRVAQERIAQRLRDLYVNGGGDTTLEVILGARSLDDVLDRLEAIQRVSSQDAEILREVQRYRREVEARRARLREARERQERLVAARAAQREAIEARLAERQRLLASVQDEIARLQAEERRRQAVLAAQARARLAAQRLAAQEALASAADAGLSAPAPEDPQEAVVVPAAPPPDGDRAAQVVAIAMQYLGVPYKWGGSSPEEGFDCSGFTSYVYAQIGISLPHHAASQYSMGVPVSRDALAAGDLVFFSGLGHVGIYIGGGQFIHAPQTGDVVKISSMSERWDSYVGARRIL
ncbi:MAG: NlpC/P60 family protein [Thermoleophilia bacterium]|nr:NlpC/P60 family protein [Gaiellaceae bacterium]MDW8337563.1 NlpC/P60 family protein [Thermoleophilia bacterium]